ncbi:hypothetical protein LWI29_002340 [Acer saccharum]|uniref:Uncharacterized protein n=1 Tax=Acer saccharum TaxID=4024 RepID=A0AA39SBA4_ACESA|nr:hypothetical protein LWI29_002340 [Acer saccharum]
MQNLTWRHGLPKPRPKCAHGDSECLSAVSWWGGAYLAWLALSKCLSVVKGRDESERHRAESQWIVAARPLCHLQYPVAYLRSAKDSTRRSVGITFQGGSCGSSAARASPTARASGDREVPTAGRQTGGGRTRRSSPDSDLEAFSHNPAHGSFAPLAFQPSAMTNCANQRFLSY